jgi:hypothetical protein
VRLEPLCVFEWRYDDNGRVSGGYVVLSPYGTEEGPGYGEGSGTVRGDRVRGRCVWSNQPRRRSDGRFVPDVRGLIETADGVGIVFRFAGRTVFHGDRGGQNLVGTFEAEDARYAWLNDAVCLAEGEIRPADNVIEIHVFVAVNELIE